MKDMMDFFPAMILISLFFSVGVTIISYTLPDGMANYAVAINNGEFVDYNSLTTELQDKVGQQRNLPLIELGALVFYSGNIYIDLLINFITALPQMMSILINLFMILFGGLDVVVMFYIESFLTVMFTLLYLISILNLFTNIRSGRVA